MLKRRRFKNTTLEELLAGEVQHPRKMAESRPAGSEREQLIRKARQAEIASDLMLRRYRRLS
ncbi:hypothetical protein CWO90_01050 [Bradyrhizobium sp. Leo121]|nr:hypothetical protein CWO90_01050 [Bradyrhizobium sp. Leo121]